MTAIIIISIILAFIALIAVCKIGLRVIYDGELTLRLYIGVLRFTLVPKKEHSVNVREYSPKSLQKMRDKAKKRLDKMNKPKKKSEKAKKTSAKKENRISAIAKKIKSTLSSIKFYIRIIKVLLKRFGSYLAIKVNDVEITVATSDAASTAITFGAVSNAVAILMKLLEGCRNVCFSKKANVRVDSSFDEENAFIYIDMIFSVRVWQIVSVGIAGIKEYIKK